MREKFGVTAVIFDERGKRYFLILHRVLNWSGWEFCKGGIDKGENERQAVLREIDEETGLTKLKIISMLPKKVSWTARETKYTYTPFVLRGSMDEPVNLEQDVIEHDAYKWADESEVENYLTHPDNKVVFREALGAISGKK